MWEKNWAHLCLIAKMKDIFFSVFISPLHNCFSIQANTKLVKYLIEEGGTVTPEKNDKGQNSLHLLTKHCTSHELASLLRTFHKEVSYMYFDSLWLFLLLIQHEPLTDLSLKLTLGTYKSAKFDDQLRLSNMVNSIHVLIIRKAKIKKKLFCLMYSEWPIKIGSTRSFILVLIKFNIFSFLEGNIMIILVLKLKFCILHVYPENAFIQKNILLVTSKHLYNIDEKDNGRSHATVSNVHWIFVENWLLAL